MLHLRSRLCGWECGCCWDEGWDGTSRNSGDERRRQSQSKEGDSGCLLAVDGGLLSKRFSGISRALAHSLLIQSEDLDVASLQWSENLAFKQK